MNDRVDHSLPPAPFGHAHHDPEGASQDPAPFVELGHGDRPAQPAYSRSVAPGRWGTSWLRAAWQLVKQRLGRALLDDTLQASKYAAFISYRHVEPDRRWAVWLHGALETFRIPKDLRPKVARRGRLGRVFRDEEELAASSHLSQDIEKALDRSEWLVVVCSPRAKQSEWIGAEIEYFKKLGRSEQILALLIEGEPSRSFPAGLFSIRQGISGDQEFRREEPLAADVRSTEGASPQRARRLAKLRLAATMLGCGFDELRQRDQERRQRRLAALAAVAFLATAIVAGLGAWAEVNRREAVAQRNTALTRLLAVDATRAAEHPSRAAGYADRALLLAATAVKLEASAETKGALLIALQRSGSLKRYLHGRGSPIRGLAFAGNGSRLISADEGGTVTAWEATTGTAVNRVDSSPEGGEISALAFDPATGLTALGGSAGWLSLCDPAATCRQLHHPTGSADITSLAFSRNAEFLAEGQRDGTVLLRTSRSGFTDLQRLTGLSGPVHALAFAANARTLGTSDQRGALILWDLSLEPPRPQPLDGHPLVIWQLAFSEDGSLLASGDGGGGVKIWHLTKGDGGVQSLPGHADTVLTLRWLGQRLLAADAAGNFQLWDFSEGMPKARRLDGHGTDVWQVAVDLAAQRFASVDESGDLRLWHLLSDTVESQALGKLDQVVLDFLPTVAFDPSGKHFAAGDLTGTVTLWDLADPAPLFHEGVESRSRVTIGRLGRAASLAVTADYKGAPIAQDLSDGTSFVLAGSQIKLVVGLAINRSGGTVAISTSEGVVTIIDLTASGPQRRISWTADDAVYGLALSADGMHLLGGRGSTSKLTLWKLDQDPPTGIDLAGHDREATINALSNDGRWGFSSDRNDIAYLWNFASPQLQPRRLSGFSSTVTAATFDGGGRLITGHGDGSVLVWDVSAPLLAPVRLSGFGRWITQLTVSDDGELLATASLLPGGQGEAALWSLREQKPIGEPLQPRIAEVAALAFASAGGPLVAILVDGRVVSWDVSTDSWHARACGIANRPLSEAERAHYPGLDEPAFGCEVARSGEPLMTVAKPEAPMPIGVKPGAYQ